MTPDTAQATRALEGLFRTYPGFRADDLEATVRIYLHAVSLYETQDVIQGISDFITGNVPDHNAAFAPSAPQVGKAVRRAMERRLDAARRERLSLPPPADDWVDAPPEAKAKSKALLDDLAASLADDLRTEEADAERQRKQISLRTNERFDPSRSPADVAKRLGVGTRYYVGDPDAENGDMGQIGASA